MAASIPTPIPLDPTFRHYKSHQAEEYAGIRPAYPAVLYEHIFTEHARGGGQFTQVLDVGCGPGKATQDLALAFDHALGLDPSLEMVKVAQQAGYKTRSGNGVRFEVGEAESLLDAAGVREGEVDMITAATAAHWFDMKKFWPQAARVLRPGGTVALWLVGFGAIHPNQPHAAEILQIRHDFRDTVLGAYRQQGNHVAASMYDDLELPWTVDPAQDDFPRDMFQRFEWDRDNVLSNGNDFFVGSRHVSVDALAAALGTASSVTRWREAHPDLAGTERDCVVELAAKMRAVVGDRPVRVGGAAAILLFRKK